MLKEKSKWRTHKDESTDAEHGGGLPRSSDEAISNGGGAKGVTCLNLLIGQPVMGRTS